MHPPFEGLTIRTPIIILLKGGVLDKGSTLGKARCIPKQDRKVAGLVEMSLVSPNPN